MKKDRFDLEAALMHAWSTSEDIDLIYHNTDKLKLNAKDCDTLQNNKRVRKEGKNETKDLG